MSPLIVDKSKFFMSYWFSQHLPMRMMTANHFHQNYDDAY